MSAPGRPAAPQAGHRRQWVWTCSERAQTWVVEAGEGSMLETDSRRVFPVFMHVYWYHVGMAIRATIHLGISGRKGEWSVRWASSPREEAVVSSVRESLASEGVGHGETDVSRGGGPRARWGFASCDLGSRGAELCSGFHGHIIESGVRLQAQCQE